MIEISACVIVKNEEKNIGRWLASMQACADELVVVDTGSTDRTQELAKAAGARLFSFAWRDDFAAAKNFALEQARGRWILFLDADEYFTPETVTHVRPLLRRMERRLDVAGILCRLTNIDLDDGGRLTTAVVQLRMFRNLRGLRYQGAIHETLTIPEGKTLELTKEVEIYHTGYSRSIVQAKLVRDLALLERRIAAGQHEPMDDRYLMDIHYGLGHYRESVAHAKALLEKEELSDELKARAYETWASCCTEGHFPDGETLACLTAAEAACPDRAEFPLMHGLVLYGTGDLPAAEERLHAGLQRHARYATRMDLTSVVDNAARLLPTAHWRLGDIAVQRGDLAAAQEEYVTGLRQQKRHAGLFQSFWRFLRRIGAGAADAIEILNGLYEKETDAAWLAAHLAKAQGGNVYLYYASIARRRGERGETPVLDYLAAGRPEAAAAAAADGPERIARLGYREERAGRPQKELFALLPEEVRERMMKEEQEMA